MKARNEYQKRVEALAPTLPALTDAQEEEARLVEGDMYISKSGQTWCGGCGAEFVDKTLWNTKRKTAVCPHCGQRHDIVKSPRKSVVHDRYYFTTTNVCGGFQVVRHFLCQKDMRRRASFCGETLYEAKSFFAAVEVSQLWLTPDGKHTVINARCAAGCMSYCDVWQLDSPLSIKTRDNSRYHFDGYISKKTQLLPEVKRNGVKNFTAPVAAYELIEAALSDPFAESLIKHKQHALLHEYICTYRSSAVHHFAKTIAVAMRHGYMVRDASLYLDYLHDLERLGHDLRNPHFVCPDNLRAAHAETQRRLDIIRRREKRTREERRMLEEAKAVKRYAERMLAFADIVLTDGTLRISAIPTVDDVRQEGKSMHHCVFSNGYYKLENALLMTARINNKRIETVEFNLLTGKVAQSRGVNNSCTKHHAKIVKLVESNSKMLC